MYFFYFLTLGYQDILIHKIQHFPYMLFYPFCIIQKNKKSHINPLPNARGRAIVIFDLIKL